MASFRQRHGMAMGVALIVLFVLFSTGLVISNLSRGLQKQVEFADASVRAQYIAETALNLLMARLMSSPYEERWFAGDPDAQAGVEYGGGSYDYFISDTKNKPLFVDIWVRSSYRNSRRHYFWRVKFQSPLLTGLATGMPVNGTEVEGTSFPPSKNDMDRFSAAIETQLEKRRNNTEGANAMAEVIQGSNDVTQALNNVGAPPPRGVAGTPFGTDPADNPTAVIPPISLPPVSTNWPPMTFNPPLVPTVRVGKSEAEMVAAVPQIIRDIDTNGEPQRGWNDGTFETCNEGMRWHRPHHGQGHGPHDGGPHGPHGQTDDDRRGPPPPDERH